MSENNYTIADIYHRLGTIEGLLTPHLEDIKDLKARVGSIERWGWVVKSAAVTTVGLLGYLGFSVTFHF